MNCTTCRYELSQCLDGRLPSGRRTVVLEHASQCDACGTFWAELQAAQQLTLRLRKPRVGSEFRDALWQRIQAGEGTPDAVFREPVPLLAKLRYALTGAAAAAAALLCVTWLGPKAEGPGLRPVAKNDARTDGPVIVGSPTARTASSQSSFAMELPSLMSSTQRLRSDLVALEAAKQSDECYASANFAVRRLAAGRDDAVEDVLASAGDFQSFGELLLHMCDNGRLGFADSQAETDLRYAVSMFEQFRRSPANRATVDEFVAPVLRRERLASLSRKIMVQPVDRIEESEDLRRIKLQWPEVFPKLFVIMFDEGLGNTFDPASIYSFEGDCGVEIVVPKSEMRGRQVLRHFGTSEGGRVEIHVRR